MASLNMDKFKVGDRVVFVENHPSDPFFPKYGATGKVIRTDGDSLPLIKWDKPNPNGWNSSCIHDSRLEKYVEPQKVVIWRDPHDMLRVVAKDTLTGETGEARCNPDDKFDFFIGAMLALGRLYGHEPEITSVKPEEKMRPAPCKFKVGDKIIGNAKANRYGITREGWIGTVNEILDEPEEGHGCEEGLTVTFIAEGKDGGLFWLSDDAFDLYEEPEEETVIHCKFKVGDKVRFVNTDHIQDGWAKKSEEYGVMTVSDVRVGGFLIKTLESPYGYHADWLEKVEQPKFFNGKVVCVRCADPLFFDWWTVGKVYEVKDGVIKDDRGDPRDPVTCVEDLSKVTFFSIKFLEIKE